MRAMAMSNPNYVLSVGVDIGKLWHICWCIHNVPISTNRLKACPWCNVKQFEPCFYKFMVASVLAHVHGDVCMMAIFIVGSFWFPFFFLIFFSKFIF